MVWVLSACDPLPNDLGGDDPATGGQSGEGSGAMASGSGGQDGSGDSGGPAGTTTSGNTASSTSGGTTSTSGDMDAGDDVKLDMFVPEFEPCDDQAPSIVTVMANQTSMGPLPVAHAVYGWDACCFHKPRLILTVDPPDPAQHPPHVEVQLVELPDAGVFHGTYVGAFQDDAQPAPSGPQGMFEVIEPLDTGLPGLPDPTQRLVARVSIAAEGWLFDVEVDAPYCAAYDRPECPCE